MLSHVSFSQIEMIIEVVVVEMVIRMGPQDHLVGEDVVADRITAPEEIIVAMRGKILVMTSPDGIQVPRITMKVGAVSQVPKSKTLLAGKPFLVAGELVQVVVIMVVGAMEMVVTLIVGMLAGVILA
jgi:hypothetical protein